jgi:hypothetical protein
MIYFGDFARDGFTVTAKFMAYQTLTARRRECEKFLTEN